jgi:hypothetical protein
MAPILRLVSVEIEDGTYLDPSNDADLALDVGETVEILVELANEGADLDVFSATLVSDDANITVVTPTVTFPAMEHGRTVKNLEKSFGLAVSDSAPQSVSNLRLRIPGLPDIPFSAIVEDEAPIDRDIASDLILPPTPHGSSPV